MTGPPTPHICETTVPGMHLGCMAMQQSRVVNSIPRHPAMMPCIQQPSPDTQLQALCAVVGAGVLRCLTVYDAGAVPA
jgi:hypothetical protein